MSPVRAMGALGGNGVAALVLGVATGVLARILTKLDLRDRVQAVVHAFRTGLGA